MTNEEKKRLVHNIFNLANGERTSAEIDKKAIEMLSEFEASAEKKGREEGVKVGMMCGNTIEKAEHLLIAKEHGWNEAIASCVERYKVLRERNASPVEIAESINKFV